MNDGTADYKMNPAEDTLLRGDQITDGMWVLAENFGLRLPLGTSEDERLRAQRFRRVNGLWRDGNLVRFTGIWIDGYSATHTSNLGTPWIVKKAPADAGAVTDARDLADMCRSGYARHAESAADLGLTPSAPGPVFETPDGGAFTITRNGRTYTVTVTPAAGEQR